MATVMSKRAPLLAGRIRQTRSVLASRTPIYRTAVTAPQLADGDLKPLKPAFDLTGKNIVLTGGGRGITYAAARAIAEFGGNVALLDVLPKPVDDFQNLSSELGVKATYIHADVSNETSLAKGFEQAADELGSIDGCIPGAGIVLDKSFVDQTWEEVARIMNVNVIGTFFAAQLATKQMVQQGTGGSIVFIASVASHVAIPGQRLSAYNGSKGAVRMLSKALAVELAPYGIRTNSISPGYIESDMTRALKKEYPQLVGVMQNAPPMKRMGTRNDLTGAIVYLLSDASQYTTGTDVQITGGVHAGRIEV